MRQMEDAASSGNRIRLISSAKREGDRIKLAVGPVHVGPESTFWSIGGTSSAVTLKTDLMGDLTIIEREPTVSQTAYAILSDLLLIVESIRAGTI